MKKFPKSARCKKVAGRRCKKTDVSTVWSLHYPYEERTAILYDSPYEVAVPCRNIDCTE